MRMKTKEQAKHTPGPWTWDIYKIARDGKIHDEVTVATDHPNRPGSLTIATVHCDWGANARLIAAAPELLEACKKAHKLIDSSYAPDIPMVMRMLEAAITKAEGK